MTVCEPESKRLQRSQGPIQGRFELCIENAVYGIRRSESRSELCPCAHPRTAARTADTCFASSELGLEGGGGTRKRLVPLGLPDPYRCSLDIIEHGTTPVETRAASDASSDSHRYPLVRRCASRTRCTRSLRDGRRYFPIATHGCGCEPDCTPRRMARSVCTWRRQQGNCKQRGCCTRVSEYQLGS